MVYDVKHQHILKIRRSFYKSMSSHRQRGQNIVQRFVPNGILLFLEHFKQWIQTQIDHEVKEHFNKQGSFFESKTEIYW